jgi:RimJ/RimL family protein N-acetyltransferase
VRASCSPGCIFGVASEGPGLQTVIQTVTQTVMQRFRTPVTLRGGHASLVPLETAHHDDLVQAVKDGALWERWVTAIPAPQNMAAEIARRLELQELGTMLPFAIIVAGRAVGMTTYMNIDALNRRVEIGSTWLRQSVQRTPVNTDCKRSLLAYAFETLDCIAVEFRTHRFNHQSVRAIERLGARLDGVLRNHQINLHPLAPQTLRDTCVYSIIAGEWPTVKAHLDHQLGRRCG